MAVIDFFDRGWTINPTAVAYRTDTREWTFDEAGRTSCRIAHALLDAGVQRETTVAVLAPNSPTAWICVLGIWRATGAWVPLNPGNPAADNADLLHRFDVAILFYDPSLSAQITHIRDRCPDLRLIALTAGTEDTDLTTWIADQPEHRPDVTYAMDDVVSVQPTGGTTGLPKGVMNTHRSLSIMVAHQMLAFAYPDDAPIVNLAAAPMTHSAGALTLHASARGGSVVVLAKASPDLILDAIQTHRVTEMFLPPTALYRLLDVLDHHDADTSSLRYVIYGSAPMSVRKLRAGIERLGPVFIECYGQTEAPAAISFLRPDEHLTDGRIADDDRLASCGRPYPLIALAVKHPDTGQPLPPGDTGEICVRGDLLMKGYYKSPEQTAETIRDGWLHTGDLGYLDANGYLHLTDRKKDMIISGGFNIYPTEVEQAIWSHPAVEDCAVVGVPDEYWGEKVTAVIELKPGHTTTADEIITLCRTRLGPVRTPKQVFLVEQLPRSINGKVLKKQVRTDLATRIREE